MTWLTRALECARRAARRYMAIPRPREGVANDVLLDDRRGKIAPTAAGAIVADLLRVEPTHGGNT
jgi:hypothetical protein